MNPFYRFSYLLVQSLSRVLFHLSVKGRANIPKGIPFIAASNHIAYFDPAIIGSLMKQEIGYLARAELFDQFLVKSLIKKLNSIPVRRGKFDLTAIKSSISYLNQKRTGLLMFPEGTRIKTGELGSPHRGIAFIASQTKVPILPIYIENSQRLLDCLFFKQRLIVRFGHLIGYNDYVHILEGKTQYQELADFIMEKIQQLKDSHCPKEPGSL